MPEAANPALDFLDDQFPLSVRRQVPAALRRGYRAVDDLMRVTPFLLTESGKFQRGDLIVKAVEYEFVKLAEAGSLPFEPTWETYAAPTGKHLVLRNDLTCVTINQVEAEKKKPRKAIFRNSLGIPNMDFLFPEWNQEEKERDSLKHTLILHGYQDLRFAFFAVPDPAANRLIEWTDNLLKIPHEIDRSGASDEGPQESPEPESIENLVRLIHDEDK